MRYCSLAILMLVPAVALADPDPNVRTTDPLARQTLAEALSRSAVVRALVAELQSTNLIVHITTTTPLPFGLRGMTRFVVSRGGYRYVRITIASNMRDQLRLMLLGHELEHAREIGQSTVNDAQDLFRLLEARGYRIGPGWYETASAQRVEGLIRRELQAKPVVELDHQHLRAGGAEAAAQVPKR